MAVDSIPILGDPTYPTSDGKPMAETDRHRTLMVELIQTLGAWFAEAPNVYVTGNLLLFYQPGNRRRHVSPDVFVVRGVAKAERLNYLTWQEGRGPDWVVEITSSSTRHRDTNRKFVLYRDTLRIPECFLFDPLGDYLDPPLQGHRRRGGQYVRIRPVQNRLPSRVLGLHLEAVGNSVRLYDPAAGAYLPTPAEDAVQARAERDRERERANRAEAAAEQLRREVEELRRRESGGLRGP